jgi:putative phosphoribosyl transferase
MPFRDREEAGRRLGKALLGMKGSGVVVLGIPRGGVVVADEVAKALEAPLDIVVTRKIGAPGEEEYGLGAVTQEGEVIVDRRAAEAVGASQDYLDEVAERKREEVRQRMTSLRGDAPYPELEGKTVIIVDDGIATGNSVAAAIMSIKRRKPARIVVAVPVAPAEAEGFVAKAGAEMVCLETPWAFFAIGEFYRDFAQVDDDEVRRILERRRIRPP